MSLYKENFCSANRCMNWREVIGMIIYIGIPTLTVIAPPIILITGLILGGLQSFNKEGVWVEMVISGGVFTFAYSIPFILTLNCCIIREDDIGTSETQSSSTSSSEDPQEITVTVVVDKYEDLPSN